MVSRLFSPPHLRLPEEEGGRRATWLELFYAHFPLLFGLLILSAGLEYAVSQANASTFSPTTLWLLGIGLLLWLLSGFTLKVVMPNSMGQYRLSVRIITFVGIMLITSLGIYLPPLLVLLLLVGILVFFVSFESRTLLKRREESS